MPGVLLERVPFREAVPMDRTAPPAWTRSTVHDFFRKTNWDNRPIEPPRTRTVSPYELTVSQFFQAVDWQWVAPARASVALGESTAIGASSPGLETTMPGPDGLDLEGLDLNSSALNGHAAIDEGFTLDSVTDLF